MVVRRYFYVDIDPIARQVAASRMKEFTTRFPQQFATTAWKASFTFLPSDIQLIQKKHMELLGPVDLIISGWECQGFSAAGFREGLNDTRSGLFTDMVQLITWAQSIFPTLGYVIENTPSQLDQREKVQEHYTLVKHYLGEPLLLDATQCGSYAHRLRNWWTNLAPLSVLQLALKYTIRGPNLQVSHILDDQSSCQPVTRQEKPPWFPANIIGKPRGAWPTFVSFPGAHAFQGDGPGLVYRHASATWDEPSPEERERAMGFQAGTTSHTKVTRLERNALLGRGMDLNSLTWLLVTCVLFQMYITPTLTQSTCSSSDATTWHPDQVHLPIFNTLHFTLSVGGEEVPCNLTQVVSDTPGGASASGETITTFYESTQLDSGEPNTPGSSNTLSNSIPCVSNYPFIMGNQLTKKERDQVTSLLIKYENVFAFSMKDLGRCKTMQFSIDLTDETPVYRRRHRLSKHEWELVDERCKELHEAGLIQPSSSDFAAATVMPAKKDSAGLWTEKRMCGDYRPLNLVTPQDRYPMPIPEELFDSIGDSNIFTIVDLRQGFNQIVLAEKDRKKTAFHGSNKLWEWLVMPFGLKNAPVFFQRVMDQVLEGADFLKCYIDDVLVHSKGLLQHLVHLEELFKRLHEVNMKIHPKKCEFAVTSVIYLGHRILPNGIMAHWAKVVAILEMPNPTDVHTLRSFIGLCNYYRIYVQDFSTIAHPLYALLKKDVAWTWSDEAQEAFNTLKEKLSEFPILRRPDFNKVFILHTDLSALGIGAILGQLDEEGKEYVIAYASRSNKAESNYSSYEGECLAVVWVVIHFRPYLYGTNFTLYTDH